MKASTKDILREVRKSGMRFFYISSIIALGVAFFCGIKATSPSMTRTAIDYFNQNNLSDFRLISTYGIRDEDIKRLSQIDGVIDVSGGYSTDQLFEIGDDEAVIRILSLPQKNGQNVPVLHDGRFPLNSTECVIEYDNSTFSDIKIGDTLKISVDPSRNVPLYANSFEVVGSVETPQFISLDHGNTNIGSGSIESYLMVTPEAFDLERFTEAYIYTDISEEGVSPYSYEYSEAQEAMISKLETVGDTILEDNIHDIRVDALKEIGDAREEYEKNRDKFDSEIASAQAQIDDGQKALDEGLAKYYEGLDTFNREIESATNQLQAAQQQLDDGYTAYELGRSEMATELINGQNKLLQGRFELNQGYIGYQSGLDEYNKQIAEAEEKIKTAQEALNDGYSQYQAGLESFNNEIAQAQEKLNQALEEYNQGYSQFKEQEEEYYKPINEAQQKLDDAWESYNTAKTKLEEQKTSFRNEITQAQEEIDKQQKQLNEKADELKSQTQAYETKLKEYEEAIKAYPNPEDIPEELKALKAELDQTKTTLEQAQEEITTSQKKIDAAQASLDKQEKEGQAELDEAQSKLDSSYATLNEQQKEIDTQKAKLEEQLRPIREQLEASKEQIDQGQEELDTQKEAGQKELDEVLATLQASETDLNNGIKELESNRVMGAAQLADSLETLQKAQNELEEGEKTLVIQQEAGEEQLNAALAELQSGAEALNAGRAELDNQKLAGQQQLDSSYNLIQESEEELESGKKELAEQKAEGEKQLDDAKQKIDDAVEEVNNLDKGQWYVYSRNDNPGYTSYQEDSERIDKIGDVFPVFFFLVAALVAFSTMTRMVEEERSQIGTLYAIGFSKWQIIKKYVIYSGSAALIGATVGTILGILILPDMIFTAYNILYNMPDLEISIPWDIIILSYLVSLLCTVGAAVLIAIMELRNVPAELMRPKAPKPGKRILLERIPFIWNRMNFISKVSARNIFRYKARFFMTVFGIAGCTALILAGFGLHDAIFTIIPNQFGSIFKYDQSLILNEAKTNLDTEVADALKDTRVSAALAADQQSVDITTPSNDLVTATLIIPEDVSEFPTFISLRDRLSPDVPIDLGDDGVVVSEKVATNYQAEPGSTIKIKIEEKWVEAKVSAQTENYLRNFIYMSPGYFEKITGNAPTYSTIFINFSDEVTSQDEEEDFAEDMIKLDTYASAVNTSSLVDSSDKMLSSLNIIVVVMIVSAAMLAFIVLNNLTNINISERMREIATLKVLGFRTRETNNYIFRENIILSIIGIIIGLFLGVLLLRYIIYTVELDIIMFGRKIFLQSYIYAVVLTLVFTIIVNLTMIPVINRVNMVESLKDID